MNSSAIPISYENNIPQQQSKGFLGGWIRTDVLLLIIFILCLWFLKSIQYALRKLKSLFVSDRLHQENSPDKAHLNLRDNIPIQEKSAHKQAKTIDPEERLRNLERNGMKPGMHIYNELLESYFCTKQYERAEKFFIKMKENPDVKPDVITYNILLRGYIEATRANPDNSGKIKYVLQEMEKIGIKPDIMTLNQTIEAGIILRDTKMMWETFDKISTKYKYERDAITFIIILSWLKTPSNSVPDEYKEKFYEALSMFIQNSPTPLSEDLIVLTIDVCIKILGNNNNSVTKKEISICTDILNYFTNNSNNTPLPLCCYGKLFTHFSQQKNPDKIISLHNSVKKLSIKLNEITYGCLLEAYLHCGKTDKIIELYENSPPSENLPFNVVIFTTLIRAYAKSKRFDKIMDLYEKSRAKPAEGNSGIKLNLIAYNALLDCCTQCEQYEAMEKILFNMLEEGKIRSPEEPLNPDIITYSTIIKGLCKSNQLEKALQIYNEMKDKNMKLDEVVFNSLLDGCVRMKSKMDVAMNLIKDMKSAGVKCSNYTYSILIKLYTKNHDIESALGVYEELKSKGQTAGVIVYTCLLQACIKHKAIAKGIEIYNEMKKSGVAPDQVAYNTIINGCVYSGKLAQGCEILCESIAKNVRLADDIYNNVLRNLLTYHNMTPTQKHQYASKICNYIAVNKINANQEYYYQVLNTLVFQPGAEAGYSGEYGGSAESYYAPSAGDASQSYGYYDPNTATPYQYPYQYQYQWRNNYYGGYHNNQ